MALEISNLKARSLDLGRFEISWETNSYVEPLDYTLQVFRSESPEGPFDPVSPPFTDRFFFIDSSVPSGNLTRQFWYQIRSEEKSTGNFQFSTPVCQEPEADLQATAIRIAQLTALTQIMGRQVWLFKKRTYGFRCNACWDSTLGQRLRSKCLSCFDTGFLRGYYNPVEVWMQIDPVQKTVELQNVQQAQQVITRARTSYYPNISPFDVLVEAENKRWRVNTVTGTERLRATIHQELTICQIAESDIEFRLPINLTEALRDVQPSPGRMFTLPTDLQATIDERTPNIFANYRTYPRSAPEE